MSEQDEKIGIYEYIKEKYEDYHYEDSYKYALIEAGAKVIAYDSFGTYSGDWLAKVFYQGKTGWVRGYYGSCSVCDDFMRTAYNYETRENLSKQLERFGREYLEDMKDFNYWYEKFKKDSEWDLNADEILDFMESNR